MRAIPMVVVLFPLMVGLLGCGQSPYDDPTREEVRQAQELNLTLRWDLGLPADASWDAVFQAASDSELQKLCDISRDLKILKENAPCSWDTVHLFAMLAKNPAIQNELTAGRTETAAILSAAEMIGEQRKLAVACGLREDAPLPAIVTCRMKKGVEEERVRLNLPPGSDPALVAVRKYNTEN